LKIFAVTEKIAAVLAWISIKLVIIMTGLMTLSVLAGVFFRYVLNSPLGWTEALARYLMIWAALLAVSACIKDQENVGLTMVVRALPTKAARVLNFVIGLIIVFFLFELTRYGIDMAVAGLQQRSLSLGITMFWPLFSVPAASGLALIQQILHMINSLNPEADKEDIFGEKEVEQVLDDVAQV